MPAPVLNRYKLIGGPHVAVDITGEPVNGKFPIKKFVAGDIVVSADDLTKKHVNKFVFAGPYGGSTPTLVPATPPTPASTPVVSPPLPKRDRAELEAMTVADLRALAAEEEIDLGPAHVKAEIVAAILAAQ